MIQGVGVRLVKKNGGNTFNLKMHRLQLKATTEVPHQKWTSEATMGIGSPELNKRRLEDR